MPTIAHANRLGEPNFWEQLLGGGPLYMLFHLLFAVSIVVALVVIIRQYPLPWMLLASCMPFIWGAAAAHTGFVGHLMVLGAVGSSMEMLPEFLREIHLYRAAYITSISLVVISFFFRKKAGTLKAA